MSNLRTVPLSNPQSMQANPPASSPDDESTMSEDIALDTALFPGAGLIAEIYENQSNPNSQGNPAFVNPMNGAVTGTIRRELPKEKPHQEAVEESKPKPKSNGPSFGM